MFLKILNVILRFISGARCSLTVTREVPTFLSAIFTCKVLNLWLNRHFSLDVECDDDEDDCESCSNTLKTWILPQKEVWFNFTPSWEDGAIWWSLWLFFICVIYYMYRQLLFTNVWMIFYLILSSWCYLYKHRLFIRDLYYNN